MNLDNCYDRQGRPISFEEWGQLNKDRSVKIVRQEDVGPWWISTVWLGLDHSFSSNGPPLIFETMVFPRETPLDPLYKLTVDENYSAWHELDMDRYSTEDEAIKGHEAMVEKWKLRLAKQADSE